MKGTFGVPLFCALFYFLFAPLNGHAVYASWMRTNLQGAIGQVTNRCRWDGIPPFCAYPQGCTSAQFPVALKRARSDARFYPVGLVPDEADCKFLGKYLCCPPSMAGANCYTILVAYLTYCTPEDMLNDSDPECASYDFGTPPDGSERIALWYELDPDEAPWGRTLYTYYTEWCEVK